MAHVMFGGLTHEPAVRLAERLVEITPAGLEHVFFADSGSVSVEVAIKMALQYQRAVGRPERTRLLTVRGGYHGDTFGAMAVCDPVGGMHSLFTGVLAEHVFAERPPDGFDAPARRGVGRARRRSARAPRPRARRGDRRAGRAGRGRDALLLARVRCVLRGLCDEHGLLLILDEIATGFGRTGALFACEHAGVAPDIMCVGKALTGGYITLAATLCTAAVAEAISAGEGGALMHGPTYMANPLACAVALASLDLLADGRWREDVPASKRGLREGLAPARELPGVVDVRVLGAIGVVQLEHDVDIAAATAAAVERGVWLRPFRDLIYAMPPVRRVDVTDRRVGIAASDRWGPSSFRRASLATETLAGAGANSAAGSRWSPSVETSIAPRRAIVSRLERSIGEVRWPRREHHGGDIECSGSGRLEREQRVIDRAQTRRARRQGQASSTARSRTVKSSASGTSRPPTPSTISVSARRARAVAPRAARPACGVDRLARQRRRQVRRHRRSEAQRRDLLGSIAAARGQQLVVGRPLAGWLRQPRDDRLVGPHRLSRGPHRREQRGAHDRLADPGARCPVTNRPRTRAG